MEAFTENEYYKIYIENGIVFGEYKNNLDIDLNAAKQIVELRLAISKGKSYPLFIDARNARSSTKAARDYLASTEATHDIKAGAFYVDSSLNKIIVNFFLSISKPNVPTKLFTNKEDAIKWLQQFKEPQ